MKLASFILIFPRMLVKLLFLGLLYFGKTWPVNNGFPCLGNIAIENNDWVSGYGKRLQNMVLMLSILLIQ